MFEDIKEFFKWVYNGGTHPFQIFIGICTIIVCVVALFVGLVLLSLSDYPWVLLLLPVVLYKFAFEHWKKNIKKS